ncbi:MAG: DMT family transporter [Bacteroidales bacterium]
MKRSIVLGHVEIFISTLFFALNIPAIKFMFDGWLTPGQILVYRLIFGTLAFWGLSLLVSKVSIPTKDKLTLCIAGAIGLFCMQFFYMEGLALTSPIDVSIILTLPPIFILLYEIIFKKEQVNLLNIGGILLAFSGALLVILMQVHSGDAANLKGNLYILASVICWALYLILTNQLSLTYNGITIMKWTFLAAAIPALVLYGHSFWDHGFVLNTFSTTASWMLLFILIFPTVLSYILIPASMKNLSTDTVSLYSYAIPVIVSIASIVMGQATLRWDQPLAIALLLLGMYLSTPKNKKQ